MLFKMYAEAVWHASEADLHDLGLTEKGPLISLKAACVCAKSNDGRTEKSKEILVESLKKAGSDRTVQKTSS